MKKILNNYPTIHKNFEKEEQNETKQCKMKKKW